MKIIGVAGQAQMGKDTLANYLCDNLNFKYLDQYWCRQSFSKEVKRLFMEVFQKDEEYVEKWKTIDQIPPGLDIPVRKALQIIGDGFRNIKSTIWIELLFKEKSDKILSDVRHINELEYIKNNNGYNILVVNPENINYDENRSEAEIRPFIEFAIAYKKITSERQFKPKSTDHIGKLYAPCGWSHIDYVIFNDGSIEDLYDRAEKIIIPELEQFFKEAA